MFSFRRMVGAGVAALGLTLGLSLPTAVAAQADPLSTKTFTLGQDLHAGDCTLFHGARWTLGSDGTASFDGVVTSSDNNDAYLLWVHLRDGRRAELYRLRNAALQNPRDSHEFIRNLPDHRVQYRWRADGTFNRRDFREIRSITWEPHC
jgi:hypothetical protein